MCKATCFVLSFHLLNRILEICGTVEGILAPCKIYERLATHVSLSKTSTSGVLGSTTMIILVPVSV